MKYLLALFGLAAPALARAADGTDLFDVMIGFMVIVILLVLVMAGAVIWLAKKQNKDPKAVLSDLIPDSLEAKLEKGLHIHLHSPTPAASPGFAPSVTPAPSAPSTNATAAAAPSPVAAATTTASSVLPPAWSPPSPDAMGTPQPPPAMKPIPKGPYSAETPNFKASDGTPLAAVTIAKEAPLNQLYLPNPQSNALPGEQTTSADGFALWYVRGAGNVPIGPALIMFDGNTYPDTPEGRAMIGHYQAALAIRAGNLAAWTNVMWTGAIAATSLTPDDWCWVNLKKPADGRAWESIIGGDADFCRGMIGYAFYNVLAGFQASGRVATYNGALKAFAP